MKKNNLISNKVQSFYSTFFKKNDSHLTFQNTIESFAEIIFDILIVASLRHIFVVINLNFFNQPSLENFETFWYLSVCLNILVPWFLFIYYVEVFEKKDLKSRFTFFFIFISVGFYVFSIYFGDIFNIAGDIYLIQEKIIIHLVAAFFVILVMGSILNYYFIELTKKSETHIKIIKKITTPFLTQLTVIATAILGILLFKNSFDILKFSIGIEVILFIISGVIIYNLIHIILKHEHIPNLKPKYLQNRFILLVTICLGELIISIFDPFVHYSIFNHNYAWWQVTQLIVVVILSIMVVFFMYAIYVDRVHNIELDTSKHSLYLYTFFHLFIIMALVIAGYGLSHDIIDMFSFFNNPTTFINNCETTLFSGIIYLIPISIINFKLLKHHEVTRFFWISTIDIIIMIILFIVLSPLMVLPINPGIYIAIFFTSMLVLNINHILKLFMLNNHDIKI